MAKFKRRIAGKEVSREILLQTPDRAYKFISGVYALPTVRDLLAERGLDDKEAERGWSLIKAVSLRPRGERVSDAEVRAAVTYLDNWDEEAFILIGAAFTQHPDAYEAVLGGMAPVIGEGAVMNAEILMDRLAALEATEEGRAALATLSRRGMTAEDRAFISAKVTTARAKGKLVATPGRAEADAAYEEALLDLRDWFTEWADIARLVVKRRDYLITLGLAERRATDPVTPGDPTPFNPDTDRPNVDDVVDPTPFIDPTKKD